ncbi:MAG TPA: nuclear transport factor 2 family protein [Longimicrobiales bacterium]
MKKIARTSALSVLLSAAVLSACATGGSTSTGAGAATADVPNHLVQLMNESAAAWNRADLDAFLSTYSSDAVFMGNPPTVGLAEIRARYQRTYFKDGRPRDQLAFDELRTTMLDPNHALMTGRCILTNPADNSKQYCRFTLIWERRPDGWKMIHDHSS